MTSTPPPRAATAPSRSSEGAAVGQAAHAIVEPGFFSSSAVQLAAAVGGLVAIVAAAVGVFTVLRGQAFAGEALGDIGAAGGSSAYLLGIVPLWGFVGIAVAAAGVMELIGIQRARGRDLATGVVLGAGFGLAAREGVLAAPTHPAPRQARTGLGLMLLTAVSLAVVSVLHLSNLVGGGGDDRPGAGFDVAYHLTGLAVLGATFALLRGDPSRGDRHGSLKGRPSATQENERDDEASHSESFGR
jgi:ABC 3 transport family